MAERHDNTKPANGGTFSISNTGTFSYLPVEHGSGLRPSWYLCVLEKLDGSLVAYLETRYHNTSIGQLDAEAED